MLTVKLVQDGPNQEIRLPQECPLEGDEIYVKKIGDLVLLFTCDKKWDIFMEGINGFSDDFAIERCNETPASRVEL